MSMSVSCHVLPTRELDPPLVEQIKKHAPRAGLRTKLGTDDTSDPRVNFAHAGISGYLVDENDQLISYGVIGQEEHFHGNMAAYMQVEKKTSMTMMYLFTTERYKNQGYAKQLFQVLIEHVCMYHPHIQHIIGECKDDKKERYLRHGGELITPVGTNEFLSSEGIAEGNYIRFNLHAK